MKYYVYILTTVNNTALYIGVTNNLSRRLSEHKSGALEGFTKRYKVHKLVYFETFDNVKYAIAREKQLKGLTRAKKNKIINEVNPDWDELNPV